MSTNLALYNETCLKCSKLTTNAYSSSFSLGIYLLDRKYHAAIYAIYGFVRFADEIVDTFHEHDKAALLSEFKADTYKAIKDQVSLNPILNSFQWAVNKYSIENELIECFLESMAMDLEKKEYDLNSFKKYILGSAEVVGLMCLRVFCEGDDTLYQKLKSPAMSLGSAFQKVNFLRDLKADYEGMGRTYFPDLDLENFSTEIKKELEADIQKDFNAAFIGIKELPQGVRLGVYAAYSLYLKLFNKIKKTSALQLIEKRIRISSVGKSLVLLGSFYKNSGR
jgi:phytoene/squalene synthetase